MQSGNFDENMSSQFESAGSFKASTAWLVSCGVGLRHFGNVIKKRSMRPCPFLGLRGL